MAAASGRMGHGLVLEGFEALADGIDVVIRPPARLAPLKQPLLHDLLGAVKDEHASNTEVVARLLLPAAAQARDVRHTT
eukprot:scaffold282443_cov28-Tisochrysis_lutea.AAC.1